MISNNIDTSDNKDNDPTEDDGGKNNGNAGGGFDSSRDNEPSYTKQSTPERWILVLGMTILAFGVIMLISRSVLFSLILITTGVSLLAYWLYIGVRLKEQNRSLSDSSGNSSPAKSRVKKGEHVCSCSICKHTESKACMELRCPCCILYLDKKQRCNWSL
ncbi:MAG: hypothetical protein GEU26_19145 [Nitrososphaeraceae archaeon]|nr:hypothetical protein [Nitrososphaeraceae archaeon]